MPITKHAHDWRPYMENVVAWWQKRGGDKPFFCRGDVFKCVYSFCAVRWFVPHDTSLYAVEVTRQEKLDVK